MLFRSIASLCDLLSRHQGLATVFFEIDLRDGGRARLRPQQFLRVRVTQELLREINLLHQGWKTETVIE